MYQWSLRSSAWPVACLFFAATLWGLVWYPLRLLEQAGLSGLWATILGYGAALVAGVVLLGRRSALPGVMRPALWLVLVAIGWCNVSFVLAVLEGPVVRVMLLFYLSPVWAAALGWLWLGERVDRRGGLSLGLALAGAMLVLWDPASGWPWPQGSADWLALSSGLAFALSNVAVRGMQAVSVVDKSLVSWLGVVVVGLLVAGVLGEGPGTVAWPVWGAGAALGVFGFLLMTLAVLYGVSRLPVRRSATILLLEVLVGAMSSHALAGESLVGREWLGGGLILLGGWLAAMEGET